MAVCAYYDTVDKSLNFIENTGGWTNGQVVGTKTYYTGFEAAVYNDTSNLVPWDSNKGNIEIVNFKVAVTPISTAFWFNSFNKNISINNLNLLDTSNVTNMRYMFRGCTSLTSLDLSSFNTSNVTDMSYMFYYCTNFILLDLSSFDTSKVTTMQSMFNNCRKLISLNLTSFDTSKVKYMDSMFYNCEQLKYIYISNLWSLNSTRSEYSVSMFAFCRNLSNFTSSYTDITRAYAGNDGNGNWGYLVDEVCAYYDSSDNSLNFVGNDHGYTNNQVVGTKTYYIGFETDNYHTGPNSPIAGLNCPWWYPVRSNINTVNFYISIMPIATSRWFSGLNYLSNINNLNLLNTSNVTDMSGMFMSCTSLTSLDLSNFDTSNVTDMSGMFSTCTSLSTLDLSNFNTSNVTDMSQMFLNCSATIPIFYVFNTPTVTRIFDSTGNNQIYLARDNSVNANTTIRDFWSNVASSYNNVHFEYDDAPWPTVSPVIDRGVYDSNNQWVEDIQGNVIKIKFNAQVYNSNVASVLSSNELTNIEIEVYGRSINTDYTVNSNSSQMINNDIGYLTLITEPDSQYEVDIILTDKRGTGIIYYAIIVGAFAMVEFRKGGHGMSIGKISERDGLDISIPTAIGEGLLLPINQQGETDLTKQQLVIGKYNQRNPDASFIIGNGADGLHRSNALEVYHNGISFADASGIMKTMFNIFHPIGSYYETSLPTTPTSGHSFDDDNLTDAEIADCGISWFDPRVMWGGTWVLEAAGMVHVSAGMGYSVNHANDNDGVGTKDGGEATHTLTKNEMPAHNHTQTAHTHTPATTSRHFPEITTVSGASGTYQVASGTGRYTWASTRGYQDVGTSNKTASAQPAIQDTGGGAAHNNMQPHINVYRWHRTN